MEHIHPILAMGNIAGDVLFFWLLISDGVLLVAVGLLALSLWNRSLVAVVIACSLALIAGFVGVTLMPLARDAFYTPTTDNLDEIHLIYRCRVVSVIWVLAVAAAVACFVRVIQKWKSKKGAQIAA